MIHKTFYGDQNSYKICVINRVVQAKTYKYFIINILLDAWMAIYIQYILYYIYIFKYYFIHKWQCG